MRNKICNRVRGAPHQIYIRIRLKVWHQRDPRIIPNVNIQPTRDREASTLLNHLSILLEAFPQPRREGVKRGIQKGDTILETFVSKGIHPKVGLV
jgi:hypothetical protein